jgi:hypothetical protein
VRESPPSAFTNGGDPQPGYAAGKGEFVEGDTQGSAPRYECLLCKSELTFHYVLRARIWKPS